MEPTVHDHDVLSFETSQIAWLRNEYGDSAQTQAESGGFEASVQSVSEPGNVASFFGSDAVVLPPRPNFAPPAKMDDNLFHIERLLKNNIKLSELTNEDWEKSFAEVQLMAYQNQVGFPSRRAAVNALSSHEAGGIQINRGLFKKSMEYFMDRITKPILDATEKKYADIWRAAEEKALEVVYREGTVAEVAAQIREQFQKLLTEFKSGAVLLFQGSSWTSKMIRALTPEGGRFSHVAMYLPKIGDHTDFLLWQSGEEGDSKAPYHPEGKKVPVHARNGPDLHSFAEALALYLEHFPGSRFVLRNIPEEHVPEEDKLKAHVDKLLLEDLVYPSPLILAFGYQLGRQPALANFVRAYFGPMDEKAHEYFCSQLVASTYLNTETLDPAKMPSAGYSPSDFGHLLHESPNRLVHKKTNKPLLLEERELRFVKK